MGYKKIQQNNPTYEDRFFVQEALFNFKNNKYTNAIFINEIKSHEYVLLSECENIKVDIDNREITLLDKEMEGKFVSTVICTDEKFGLGLNNFFLMVDENKPLGTKIEYFLVFNDNRKFPIKPNGNMPLKIEGVKPINFKIIAKLTSNVIDSPSIRSIAVGYYDKMVENQLGLIKPNLRPTGEVEEVKTFLEFESLSDLM